MQCPACRHDNPSGSRFCLECGGKLPDRCPSCRADLPEGAKFCHACGAPLPTPDTVGWPSPETYTPRHLIEKILISRTALEGERKQITVLFADLKGSMELLADRDPEEARRILDPVLEVMMEAVHEYEGTVNQVMGDGIMALFGAPIAHEDHAVRACLAALRMQESVTRYAAGARRSRDVAVQIRVGLNSGEVVVGAIGGDLRMDYTAVGQTTHLAARMEQLAPPGDIWMTGNTRRLAEGHVEATPLGLVSIKGMSTPVEVHELTSSSVLRSRLRAVAARGLSRFVGRDTELEALRRAQNRAGAGHGEVVAVVGEPGVGKSRFIWEFLHSQQVEGWKVIQAGGVSYAKTTAYLPVIELLRSYAGIEPRDSLDTIRAKTTAKMRALDPELEPTLPGLLSLLDAPIEDPSWDTLDPSKRRERTIEDVRRVLTRQSQVEPLLLVLEDLHWVDGATQAVIDRLVDGLPAARLLLLLSYRPEYRHAWSTTPHYTDIRIEPFTPDQAMDFLDAVLGRGAELQALKRLLVDRTGGNPFFLEENVHALLETGVLIAEQGGYRLAKSPASVQVPPTVQAVIAARIDRLVPSVKSLLQTAAVVGLNVPLVLLHRIAAEPEDVVLERLAHLQSAELLYATRTVPDAEYEFKHALTHDVAYGTLLQDRRRSLHARIVEAIEDLHRDRLAEQAERLAHHAVMGEVWDKAVGYLQQAGRRAIERSANVEAIRHLSKGLEILEALPPSPIRDQEELDFQLGLGSALIATKGWAAPDVERTYVRARELCQVAGQTAQLFPVMWGLCTFFLLRAQPHVAVDVARRFAELAKRAEDDGPRVVAPFLLGNTKFWLGEFVATRRHLEDALHAYDPSRHGSLAYLYGQDIRVTALCYMAWVLWPLGYPDQALAASESALRLARETSHAHSIAYAEGVQLWIYQHRGDVDSIRERADDVIAFAAAQGFVLWTAVARLLRGWAAAGREHGRGALLEMREALSDFRTAGAELPCVALNAMFVDAHLRTGRPADGLAIATEWLAFAQSVGDRAWEAELYRLKGECLLASEAGHEGEAEECFRQAVAVARAQDAKSWELKAVTSLARMRRQQHNGHEAGRLLHEIYDWFTEGFDTNDLGEAKALLDELRHP
jgi:class 3 adenylate cyclase/tetratricopeptide (TPR) repeat protein